MSVSNLTVGKTNQEYGVKAYSADIGLGGFTCEGNIVTTLGAVDAPTGLFDSVEVTAGTSVDVQLADLGTPIAISGRKGRIGVTAAVAMGAGVEASITLTGADILATDQCMLTFANSTDIDATLENIQCGVLSIADGQVVIRIRNNSAGAYGADTIAIWYLLI